MAQKNFEYIFDDSLHEVFVEPELVRQYLNAIDALMDSVDGNPVEFVKLAGEAGVFARILGNHDQAERLLKNALEVIENHNLGLKLETQQKIRLAHVLQWKKEFERSTLLFEEIVSLCRSNVEVKHYLDFAIQHFGKNCFDQQLYEKALSLFKEALSLRLNRSAPLDVIQSSEFAIKRTLVKLQR